MSVPPSGGNSVLTRAGSAASPKPGRPSRKASECAGAGPVALATVLIWQETHPCHETFHEVSEPKPPSRTGLVWEPGLQGSRGAFQPNYKSI